jgi:hypothetical protein
METGSSYVYFALKGDNFDTDDVTNRLGITPTDSWRKGDKGFYKSAVEFAMWRLAIDKGKEYLQIDNLVDEIVSKLFDKVEIINDLKRQFKLDSVLEIVLYIDTNEDNSTPALGHDLRTIEFLYKTGTMTDIDIYRFNSGLDETNEKV